MCSELSCYICSELSAICAQIPRKDVEAHLQAAQSTHLLLICGAMSALQTEVSELRDWRSKQLVQNLRWGLGRLHLSSLLVTCDDF
jgi:hypothetical protein